MSPKAQKSRRTQSDFKGASDGKVQKKKFGLTRQQMIMIGIGVPVLGIVGYVLMLLNATPPKGNNLYGLCRAYIELHLQYPETMQIIELKQSIPDGEDKNNPQRINYDVTVSYIDGFGQRQLNTITCGLKFNQDLANTPWQGIYLERVLFNSKSLSPNKAPKHGMVDVYYPLNQKNPRRFDDYNENLEIFYNGIPSLLVNPPDLTLPRYDLNRMKIVDLKSLNETN